MTFDVGHTLAAAVPARVKTKLAIRMTAFLIASHPDVVFIVSTYLSLPGNPAYTAGQSLPPIEEALQIQVQRAHLSFRSPLRSPPPHHNGIAYASPSKRRAFRGSVYV